MNRTYRHGPGWMTEVTADKFSSGSRPATDQEIEAALADEARASKVAAFTASLDPGVTDTATAKPAKAK